MKTKTKTLFALLSAITLIGCSTDYQPWQGSQVILQGTGGTCDRVDGIDFWTFGTPPRRYQIIGMIQDSRRNGIISRATYKHDIADKAKRAGGDAVALQSRQSEYRGSISGGTANSYSNGSATAYGSGGVINAYGRSTTTTYGTGYSVPIVQKDSTFFVLKYVD